MTTLSRNDDPAGTPKMLTLEDVARILDVTPPTARSLVRSGEITGFQIGGRGMWRVDPADLQAYITREKKRAQERRELSD